MIFRLIAPKALGFAISFFTVAIYWVTHHYIFHRITHSNWKLMWYNNLLLFWLAIVPFTTAFIGDYPTQPLIVFTYALNLFLATLTFSLLTCYVFFKSDLMADSVSDNE
ncbi:MAG TPA: TMEM175 family protein, partial [Pyrinomonadaceae bacterium]|nr:TMEM175 family protein [Pyrinomonadaceae bacterium]